MKRFFNIILALAVLIPGLWGCQPKTPETPQKVVDLRYRVDDSYELDAISPQSISIIISSTDPWTVTTAHPEWCTIDIEEGAGSNPDSVHVGLGTKTTVHVQYYDNNNLDDRDDIIEIRSDYWLGKKVKVHQKGTAFLAVDKTAQAPTKAAANYTVNVLSNQKWSAKFVENTDTVTLKNKNKVCWIAIDGANSGEGDGSVTVAVIDNPEEQRQGILGLFDRNNVEQARVTFTQEGVLLKVQMEKFYVGYNQTTATIEVDSNAAWKIETDGPSWFSVGKTEYTGKDTIVFTFDPNDGETVRSSEIKVTTVAAEEGGFVASRYVEFKQGYKVTPVTTVFNQAEYDSWKEQGSIHGVYISGSGIQFSSGVKIQKDLPFGDYSFYWRDLGFTGAEDGRIKTLFAFGLGQEVKYYLSVRADGKGKTDINFNTGDDGENTSPEVDNIYFDPTVGHKLTYCFMPVVDSDYCTVVFYLDDQYVTQFTSADKVMYNVKWGSNFNTYLEVDKGGVGTLEKYEYSAPIDWGN